MFTLNDLAKILSDLTNQNAGKVQFQKFYEFLHQISLQGMNIGGWSSINDSGELGVISYVNSKLNQDNNISLPYVVFDVGANVGTYTKSLLNFFGQTAKIHAFEPMSNTFQKLLQNINSSETACLYNFGFSDENGTMTLFSNAPESGLASLINRRLDHFNMYMNYQEKVTIRTIDDYCDEQNINRIHFLKLDVEGNELKVLKGAENKLKSGAIDFIQFEFGGCNIDSRTFFQDFYYLLNDKYNLNRIVRDGIYPLNTYKEMYEIFNTSNFLAELKK